MKPSQLSAEYPAVNRTAFSDPAVSNSGRLLDFAGVRNRRWSLKKQGLESFLDVKPSAAFLGPHAILSPRCTREARHVRLRGIAGLMNSKRQARNSSDLTTLSLKFFP